MATATRKKQTPQRRHKAKAAAPGKRQRAAAPAFDPLADIDEPERSAPPMAEIDAEALEFIAAIDRFKKAHGRPFPSWSEILLIVRQLGYRRP